MMAYSNKGLPFVLWSCVARNDTILVEAGEDSYDGGVSITGKELLARDPTPGWEFHTQSRKSQYMGAAGGDLNGLLKLPQRGLRRNKSSKSHWKPPRLKGIKFHIYERDSGGEYLVWVFACVYNPNNISKALVQTFLTKLVVDTQHCRETDNDWLNGPTLACQATFGPVLQHYMMQVSHLVKCAEVEKHIETAKDHMSKNIEILLERDAKLEDLNDEANKLQEMALVFKRRARDVKRMKLWQDAKHGMAVGLAITAGVAVVTVPPLIALL